jgi:cytochrome c oxidase assembly protein subunit 15
MVTHPPNRLSPWPHRLAVALALVTFPLIWVGGLVTTYDAGMAVPDWPNTYGYNLLLYPWQTWLGGPWDLFIEHGHRLLGMTAGILAIALVSVVFSVDRRPLLRVAAVGALVLVIVQGALGGARVLFDERLVAMVHGCIGPLFFAYLAALVVITSRWWQSATRLETLAGQQFARAACLTAGLAYAQLVLGAIVRHVPLAASPQVFRAALALHLVVAAALIIQTAWTAWQARTLARATGAASAHWICLLVALQVALGAATYVVKFSWPAWMEGYSFAAGYVIQERSLGQSLIITAHVANGSLILFAAVFAAMRAARIFFGERPRAGVFACTDPYQPRLSAPLGRIA